MLKTDSKQCKYISPLLLPTDILSNFQDLGSIPNRTWSAVGLFRPGIRITADPFTRPTRNNPH